MKKMYNTTQMDITVPTTFPNIMKLSTNDDDDERAAQTVKERREEPQYDDGLWDTQKGLW